MKWIKRIYLQCIPLRFGVCLSFYLVFRLYCVTTVTPFIRRSQGWSLRSGRVLTSRHKNAVFFRRNSNLLQFFSAPSQEGNLFFLSGRSARKKIYNYPHQIEPFVTDFEAPLTFVHCLWPMLRAPTNLHQLKLETLLGRQFALTQTPKRSGIHCR